MDMYFNCLRQTPGKKIAGNKVSLYFTFYKKLTNYSSKWPYHFATPPGMGENSTRNIPSFDSFGISLLKLDIDESIFAARSHGDLSSRHWNPGLEGLVWGWDSSLLSYPSGIFIHHTWVRDQPVLCLYPGYQSGWMRFL